MAVKTVRLADAVTGDLVRCGVTRRGRRGWSFYSKVHVCEVDHRYGEHVGLKRLHVRPLCGAEPGRAESPSTIPDEQCQRCAAIVARREERS